MQFLYLKSITIYISDVIFTNRGRKMLDTYFTRIPSLSLFDPILPIQRDQDHAF
jgi:hypothetical protein